MQSVKIFRGASDSNAPMDMLAQSGPSHHFKGHLPGLFLVYDTSMHIRCTVVAVILQLWLQSSTAQV